MRGNPVVNLPHHPLTPLGGTVRVVYLGIWVWERFLAALLFDLAVSTKPILLIANDFILLVIKNEQCRQQVDLVS